MEIVAASLHTNRTCGIVLHAMQASSQEKQQSNCVAGGNPKFPKIGNHGCQLACGIKLHIQEAGWHGSTWKMLQWCHMGMHAPGS